MNIVWNTFWQPKRGNAPNEYEDSFWPERLSGVLSSSRKFAVADGASESMQSGPWAKILAKCYCRSRSVGARRSAGSMVTRAYGEWESWQADYLRRRQESGRPLQWYEEPGFRKGAFATLVGVALRSRDGGQVFALSAAALGDSCLFLVRDGNLAVRFPVESSREFGRSPICLSSKPSANRGVLESFRFMPFQDLFTGDRLYLMTDALAAWFLGSWEEGFLPWATLDDACGFTSAASPLSAGSSSPSPTERFAALVESFRSDKALRNDDVTLTRIELV